MKAHFTTVGHQPWEPLPKVDLDSIPREGDVVTLPGDEETELYVRTVIWHPWHVEGPFVYIVIGPRRPG